MKKTITQYYCFRIKFFWTNHLDGYDTNSSCPSSFSFLRYAPNWLQGFTLNLSVKHSTINGTNGFCHNSNVIVSFPNLMAVKIVTKSLSSYNGTSFNKYPNIKSLHRKGLTIRPNHSI
jgi:hypothetical protein